MITVALGGFLFVIFRCYRNNSIRLSSFFNRRVHWEYYRELYKKHNEVEKLFRRLKGYRRVFSRFDILGVISMWFIVFALIFDMLRQCEHALASGESNLPFGFLDVESPAVDEAAGGEFFSAA